MPLFQKTIFSLLMLFTACVVVAAEDTSSFVTVQEYTDFLNAVAPADPHVLYHETMSEIVRDGEPGDYQYEAVAGEENLPITFVTWFDEARYCNWKEHGSPARDEATPETTETGSYTLNDDINGRVVKNPGAHYFLPTSEEDNFIDPTLAFNDRGFSIVEVDGGDHFNAASFLEASHPSDGTWSTFDEVIGVVGVIGVIGSSYAAYRCLANRPHEQIPNDRTVDGTTAANRRAAEDQPNPEREAVVGGTSEMLDDVTGKATNEINFAQDQRSGLKKWADWLRGRSFPSSIFQDADQIDYIQGDNLTSGEQQSRFQKFIRWMTQRFYTYKDVEDFKNRNPEYLQKQINGHAATIVEHEATIAGHVLANENHPAVQQAAEYQAKIAEHEGTIAALQQRIQGHEQTQQEKKAEEAPARLARFDQLQEDQKKLYEATQLILKISQLESSCYSAAAAVVEHAAASSAVRVLEPSLTPFQMLREATQYLVIKKLQEIEKVARKSQHADGEELAVGQIQTQYHEVCKADAELMERLKILASKKELLWKFLAEMGNDFVDAQQVQVKFQSIKNKISGIETSITNYSRITQEHFGLAKNKFDGDQQSNATRESADRSAVGSRASTSGSAEKKQKTGFRKFFHLSSDYKELSAEDLAAAAARDLQIENACRELGERIEEKFSGTVHPITDRVEKLFVQSYEMLHLAEKNALLGSNLMRLYEADQGRKLWETSPLRPYLVDALTRARARVNSATTLLAQEKTALGGIWEKHDGGAGREIYCYQGGGWQTFSKEADIAQEIKNLQTRTQNAGEDKLNLLARKIADAKAIERLLETAKAQGEELLSAPTATLEAKRGAFLAAMKELLSNPILQPDQRPTNQGQSGEGKKDGST